MNEIMTITDLSEYLNVDRRTLYRLVQKGEVPGFKIGGAWRFDKTDIDNWVAEKKKKHISQSQ